MIFFIVSLESYFHIDIVVNHNNNSNQKSGSKLTKKCIRTFCFYLKEIDFGVLNTNDWENRANKDDKTDNLIKNFGTIPLEFFVVKFINIIPI